MKAPKESARQAKAMERLFDDFYNAASGTFQALEIRYGINGVCKQVFGDDVDDELARENLRKNWAWTTLVAVYDYAIHGIVPDPGHDGESSLVINASDVLKLASSEDYSTSTEWENIIAMGDGRFALDEGSPIPLYKIALLANVDVRTVRNAVSAGELVTFKAADGDVFAENASARRWLHGRRGFKPTIVEDESGVLQLERVDTPAMFAALLKEQRKRQNLEDTTASLPQHPCVTQDRLTELESGVFTLPLDAVFPIADYYLLDRKKFLRCVMRVFFYEEQVMLTDSAE